MRKIKISPAFGQSTTPVPAILPLKSHRRAGSHCLHRPSPSGPPGPGWVLFIFSAPPGEYKIKYLEPASCAKNSALVTACRPRGRSRGFAQQACLVASPLRVMPLSHHHLSCRCLGPFPCPLVSSPLSVKLPSSTRCRCNARSLRRSASTSCSNSERKIFSRA